MVRANNCPDGETLLWDRCWHASWLKGLVAVHPSGFNENSLVLVSPFGKAVGRGTFSVSGSPEGCGTSHNRGVLSESFLNQVDIGPIKQIEGDGQGGCVLSWEGRMACYGGFPRGSEKSFAERLQLLEVDLGSAVAHRICSNVGNSDTTALIDDKGVLRVFGRVVKEDNGVLPIASNASLEVEAPEEPVQCMQFNGLICTLSATGHVHCLSNLPGTDERSADKAWLKLPLPIVAKDLIGTSQVLVALTQDGTLWAWRTGELLVEEVVPKMISVGYPVLAADMSASCFILEGGAVGCRTGSLNEKMKQEQSIHFDLTEIADASPALAISGVGTGGCALAESGRVSCWGLATKKMEPHWGGRVLTPQLLPSVPSASVLTSSTYSGCAVAKGPEGSIWCWGDEIASPDVVDPTSPFLFAPNPLEEAVAALTSTYVGMWQAGYCLRSQDGQVVCWGASKDGSLGVGGQLAYYDEPTPLVWEVPIAWVTPSLMGTCAGSAEGETRCWGYLPWSETGQQTSSSGESVPFMSGAAGIADFEGARCYVSAEGEVWCIGLVTKGLLGPGKVESGFVGEAQKVEGLSNVTKVSFDGISAVALRNDGTAVTWGTGGCYATGVGVPQHVESELVVPNIPGFVVDIDQTVGTTCALTDAGDLYCWGTNAFGEAGVGTLVPVPEPALVNPAGPPYAAISGAYTHIAALDANGAVWSWGDNELGQAGFGREDPPWNAVVVVEPEE
jgi:alpha-tubulin suppressor-like RCC1 family protein